MELAALYERAVARNLAVSLYAAPVGEPAVGPAAFPHRPSAANDPLAPISHHWQDGTHITFGVLTAGVFTRNVMCRSEEHTSELQSLAYLVCRLLLEKKKKIEQRAYHERTTS